MNLESLFVKEFRNAVRVTEARNIYQVPLPQEVNNWVVSGSEMFLVRGIELEEFSGLDGKLVRKLPQGVVAKQRVIDKVSRKFAVKDGEYVKVDYKIPTGSEVIISPRKLPLGYEFWKGCVNGYGYVDSVVGRMGIEYLYVLPRNVLYRVQQTALVISVKNMKNYAGMGYATWNMGKIFIHVIPYKPNVGYIGSRVLKTGCTVNYSREVSMIVDYWQKCGLIPNISLCDISDGTNLCLSSTVVGYDSYDPVDVLPVGNKEEYGGI